MSPLPCSDRISARAARRARARTRPRALPVRAAGSRPATGSSARCRPRCRRSRELLHAIPHDRTLYESRSHGQPTRGWATIQRDGPRRRTDASLGVVLACVVGTMAIGAASKAPCASGAWSDLRQYRQPLLHRRRAAARHRAAPRAASAVPRRVRGGRRAQLRRVPGRVTMYVMRVASWISGDDYAPFYWVNALLLTGFAVAIGVMLYVANGSRALYFALAPTLLVYGTVNWDLVAVAFATGGLLAFFLQRRDRGAGVALGSGPRRSSTRRCSLVPLLAQRLRERRPDGAIVLGWTRWARGCWSTCRSRWSRPRAWLTFFRFNGERGADFDSLWYIACRHLETVPRRRGRSTWGRSRSSSALSAAVWAIKARRHPRFPRWTLGLPLLVAVPALEQGVLAAVRALAAALVRARAAAAAGRSSRSRSPTWRCS